MRTYELLYIVPGQYADTEIEGIRQNVAALVEKTGAKITRHENLGKIKLAYPINKVRHGTYILVLFDLENHDFSALDRDLRLNQEILRHQIIAAQKSAATRRHEISSYQPPLSEEARRETSPAFPSSQAPASRQRPAAPVPLVPVPAKESSLSIEELDKKLDQLLDDDIAKSI